MGIWGGDTRDRLNHQDERFWGVLEVVGSRYSLQTGGFVGDIGVDGGDGGDYNGVGC